MLISGLKGLTVEQERIKLRDSIHYIGLVNPSQVIFRSLLILEIPGGFRPIWGIQSLSLFISCRES